MREGGETPEGSPASKKLKEAADYPTCAGVSASDATDVNGSGRELALRRENFP